jgi:hypothetical protein
MDTVIVRQRLKERKHEIEELMHMLMTRYDLLSKKEYHDKMELLQCKHKEVEEAMASGSSLDALNAHDVIGVQKRKAMTLAEQIFAKSKDDLKKDQKDAEDFIRRMNEQRHDIERRKKEHKEMEARKAKEAEDKAKVAEEEKRVKAEEDRKVKLENLERDIKLREE